MGLCIGAACQCSIYASTFYTQLFVLFNIFNSHKINLNQRWTAKKRCVYKLQSVLVPAELCSTRSYFIVIFPIQKWSGSLLAGPGWGRGERGYDKAAPAASPQPSPLLYFPNILLRDESELRGRRLSVHCIVRRPDQRAVLTEVRNKVWWSDALGRRQRHYDHCNAVISTLAHARAK